MKPRSQRPCYRSAAALHHTAEENTAPYRAVINSSASKCSALPSSTLPSKGGPSIRGPSSRGPSNRVLYIGNLNFPRRRDLLRIFRFYGKIARYWLAKCGSYAFVAYTRPSDANFAKSRLDGYVMETGLKILVDWADVQT